MPLQIDVPGKIIAVGLNYPDHVVEGDAAGIFDDRIATGNGNQPTFPYIFGHWPNALIGPGDTIVLPDRSIEAKVDYEAELAFVMGSRVKNVSRENALEAVRGYCAFNDVSARGIQLTNDPKLGMQLALGKSVDTFDPVGAMTPASEIDPQNLRIRLVLNGEVMQDFHTSTMLFPVAEVIEYISRLVTLEPGDLITTGTDVGVGIFRDPQVFLQDGDEVTVDIEGLETLTNPVRSAA